MRMKAPDNGGIDIGGQHFSVADGFIDIPDDFTAFAIAALTACGFTLVTDAGPAEPVAMIVPDAPAVSLDNTPHSEAE